MPLLQEAFVVDPMQFESVANFAADPNRKRRPFVPYDWPKEGGQPRCGIFGFEDERILSFRVPFKPVRINPARQDQLIKQFGLKHGDHLLFSRDQQLIQINGVDAGKWERLRYQWELIGSVPRKLLPLDPYKMSDRLIALSITAPMVVGRSMVVSGMKASRKSSLAREVVHALPRTYGVGYLQLERINENPHPEAIPGAPHALVMPGAEIWNMSSRMPNQEVVDWTTYGLLTMANRAMFRDMVFILDSFFAYSEAVHAILEMSGVASGASKSGGLSRVVLERIRREIFAWPGHPVWEGLTGSLTGIGISLTNPFDKGSVSLAQAAQGQADQHAVCLNDENVVEMERQIVKPPLYSQRFGETESRMLETIVGPKHARNLFALRAQSWKFKPGSWTSLITAFRMASGTIEEHLIHVWRNFEDILDNPPLPSEVEMAPVEGDSDELQAQAAAMAVKDERIAAAAQAFAGHDGHNDLRSLNVLRDD